MYEIIQNFDHDIFAEKEGPFVSIYQNTDKTPSEAQQNTLTFKNHLKTVEASLKEQYDKTLINKVMNPLRELKENRTFWNHNLKAVAIFASQNDYVVIRLNNEVKEKAIVADSFHTKPLIRHFQTGGMFDVLTLNREQFALYTCTQDTCIEVEFEEGTPVTKKEVLGTLDEDGYLAHSSYNGASNEPMYHGHEDNKDIIEKDTKRYFRYVDDFINDTYSKQTKRPLILWTLPEHQGEFHKVSKNKYLLDDGVNQSDKDLDEEKVLTKAWEIMKPRYEKEMKTIVENYKQAVAKDLGSDDIDEIAKKVIEANIDTALIASDKSIPGKLNKDDGTITYGEIDDPRYDDVLDDLAEQILDQGGSVVVLGEDEIPTKSGIAVIFRY